MALSASGQLVVNPQVLNEFSHNVIRKFQHLGIDGLFGRLEAMQVWCKAPMNEETPLFALTVHRRHGFSFYDSSLLASALLFGCDMFLTEDMHSGQTIGDMRLINPFEVAPDDILSVS